MSEENFLVKSKVEILEAFQIIKDDIIEKCKPNLNMDDLIRNPCYLIQLGNKHLINSSFSSAIHYFNKAIELDKIYSIFA